MMVKIKMHNASNIDNITYWILNVYSSLNHIIVKKDNPTELKRVLWVKMDISFQVEIWTNVEVLT